MMAGNKYNYRGFLLVIAKIICLFFNQAGAHENRPLYVEITEDEPQQFIVQWKIPSSVLRTNFPRMVLPVDCIRKGEKITLNRSGAFLGIQRYQCPEGLNGQQVGIHYPKANPSVSTLFRVQMLSGEVHTQLLTPKESSWIIPEQENRLQVAREYTVLGILHILKGIDHLLFVGCLLLIAGTGRRILITITGFTIAHSITLLLSALELVHVPIPPVEATIAMSIVFLATEIAKESRDTLTYRYPITVATVFGLLHGFGFAAVLKSIGLPQTEILTSLLFFNVGVEIGQILFVGFIIITFLGVQAIANRLLRSTISFTTFEKPVVYVIGSVASLWMFERIYLFL
jgi:hypothetical protein